QMSQTEIISLLLCGAPNADRSGGQGGGAERAGMVRNAVGLISASVSGEIERTFISDLGVPLDYFEFRPTDPSQPFSGAQLAAGWQLGRKTFVVLNAGFCQSQSGQVYVGNTLGASLQFRISPEWRTEASFEPVSSCGTTVPGAAGLVGSDIPLGIVPGGTGNILARNLRLPRRPTAAAKTVLAGEAMPIDLGLVERADGQHYFAVCAGAGFDAEIMALTEAPM